MICSERDFVDPNVFVHHARGWAGRSTCCWTLTAAQSAIGLNGVPGPLIALSAARQQQLALSDFFGCKNKMGMLDGALGRKRVSATLSTPDAVTPSMLEALNSDHGVCDMEVRCSRCWSTTIGELKLCPRAGDHGPQSEEVD